MWLRDSTLFDHMVVWWRIGRPTFGTAMYIFSKLLQFVKYQLKRWNRRCFGNIFHDKGVAQAELNNIMWLIHEKWGF